VGKAMSIVSFKKSYFLLNLNNQAMLPRYQSYLSNNYWMSKMSDENNPDNYQDHFHKIDKIKVVWTDLNY
jgi:hypothetical protein